mmetsp:Transcript_55423/g.82450  ORF Transcript_55423/g.82450 Transcript_55423/m.82450 type:complete len:87 (+) Transcript_55423:411-671(+)
MYAPPQKRANVPRDMRYISANLIRQRNHFEAIRNIAGKEMIADIYVRDPKSITWWFAGKVARVSGRYFLIQNFFFGVCYVCICVIS